jgi:hypothetical protein
VGSSQRLPARRDPIRKLAANFLSGVLIAGLVIYWPK